MTELNYRSIKEAYPAVLKAVLTSGSPVEVLADGTLRKTIELRQPLLVNIQMPNVDMIAMCKYGKAYLDAYARQLVYGENTEGFDYNYHNRIFNFQANFEDHEINQIDEIVHDLTVEHCSRKEVAMIWEVHDDLGSSKAVPCLCLIDFKLRDNNLNMLNYFRSWDCFGAMPANCYGLARLLEYVAGELFVEVGRLSVVSSAAHIYMTDYNDALRLIGGVA